MKVRELMSMLGELTECERDCDVVVKRVGRDSHYSVDGMHACRKYKITDNRLLIVLEAGDKE